MKTLPVLLGKDKAIKKIKKDIKNKISPVSLSGCTTDAVSHIIASLGEGFRVNLVITHDEIRARELTDELSFYGDKELIGECLYYPARDFLFYSADIHGNAILRERLNVIRKLAGKEKVTIVTTPDAGMDHSLSFSMFTENKRVIKVGDEIDTAELRENLVFMGYERVSKVENEGEFSIRGEIIDIFPLTSKWACRIDLAYDEVESVKYMDVESQRSLEKTSEVCIYPAREVFLPENAILSGLKKMDEEMKKSVKKYEKKGQFEASARIKDIVNTFRETYEIYNGFKNIESFLPFFTDEYYSFFDYFNRDETIAYIEDYEKSFGRLKAVETEFVQSMASRLKNGYILPSQANILFSANECLEKMMSLPVVVIEGSTGIKKEVDIKNTYHIRTSPTIDYNKNFNTFVEDIKNFRKKGYRIILMTPSKTAGKRLCEDLKDFDILAFYKREYDKELVEGDVLVTRGAFKKGFECKPLKLVVITQGDIWGIKSVRKKRKTKKRRDGLSSIEDLKPGDYVIHEKHGIGVYEGIEKIKVENVTKDYLKILYDGNSRLYITVTSMDCLQKYASGTADKKPRLSNLNTSTWKKTKERVYKEVKEIAKELVDLYAKRQVIKGFRFSKDTVWQSQFEENFPYEETDDQLKAIEAVKADMESDKIMDRLICGDVGFGKTEVAIRAAFKAVMSSKQVVVLVPTTILASQHYNTFSARMEDFGIEVAMISRLRTPKENKKTLNGLKNGLVDIVIGTHRLLGKDVEFKRLGLLIIDEEQRFGVTHKEKIKKLRENVDVMAMSATPIPRTLQMSLTGIRDMSLLDEAPVDRMPIQTFVIEKNNEIIRDAIVREMARKGQVYYVYNRVGNMDMVVSDIRKLVPEAVVAYAHGQMRERELEDTMYSFIKGDIDVLISTTIVETGLDIPNVNTILIDDADRFGLGQLYQLRGRVGRSDRTAYAFLMYKRDKILKEVAWKRLEAIKEFTDLGSGFKISMRDLEIRGAGNILGAKQHGHIEAVGYDLYCKMLSQAVKKIKGIADEEADYETSIELPIDAYIPNNYIENEIEKIDIYKRISAIESEDEREDMEEELEDRFGKLPLCVKNLLEIAVLKKNAHDAGITEINDKRQGICLYIYDKEKIDVSSVVKLVDEYKGNFRVVPENRTYFQYKTNGNVIEEMKALVPKIKNLMNKGKKGGK